MGSRLNRLPHFLECTFPNIKNKKAVLPKHGFPVLICPLQFCFWNYINLCGALCRCTAQINIEKNYDIVQLSKLRSPFAMK